MSNSDSDLLSAAAAGDRDAFARFVRQHTPAILRYCLLRLENRHDGEDAAQEAMLRLFDQVRCRRVPREPLPWLFAVARRCCLEAARRRRRDSAEPLQEALVPAGGDCPGEDQTIELRKAISLLNDFEAAVLHLKHTEGLRCRQIAERLGSPLGTVTATLSRAYGKLRITIERERAR